MIKRCLLLLFLLLLAPAAFAMPGDCFSTCDRTAPCGTETCQDCVWPYSDTECIQWGYAECQWYGLCGQTICSVVREYDVYESAGNWQLYRYLCYKEPNKPGKGYERYTKRFLRKHYRVTRCSNGTETTELVYQAYVWSYCDRQDPFGGGCRAGSENVTYLELACPF